MSSFIELRDNPLDYNAKRQIAEVLFCLDDVPKLQPYFRYYARQCKQIIAISHANGFDFPLKSHTDVLRVVGDILDGLPHAEISSRLAERHRGAREQPAAAQLDNSIDLALRLLSMLDVGSFQNAYTGRNYLTWTDGPIGDFLSDILPLKGEPRLSCEGVKLDPRFTAVNLERIAGFEVQLTTNLADHLLLREDRQLVCIFHHAAFLQCCRRSSTIFPDGFVEETLQTIALLFPKVTGNKARVKRWYKRKAPGDEADPVALDCGKASRRIEEYKFWRDRLVLLKEAYDESRPQSITQWWHDRRDGLQWYALWLAIFFTVLFGLIQSIEGAISLSRNL